MEDKRREVPEDTELVMVAQDSIGRPWASKIFFTRFPEEVPETSSSVLEISFHIPVIDFTTLPDSNVVRYHMRRRAPTFVLLLLISTIRHPALPEVPTLIRGTFPSEATPFDPATNGKELRHISRKKALLATTQDGERKDLTKHWQAIREGSEVATGDQRSRDQIRTKMGRRGRGGRGKRGWAGCRSRNGRIVIHSGAPA
ncbi:hypothetical protein GSI_13226 [Ganoderma sinense ZZ0214-1]|uniref:Uncharacterized protein n=1 Tax=Ganoderma sinense ZZ0214-1 TaxID=1077348 RepID=A0A2G8RUZ5_9APHY|nr:hypothetical protein GSI_13226 [Ganoderma sinense ZZ0214-1]